MRWTSFQEGQPEKRWCGLQLKKQFSENFPAQTDETRAIGYLGNKQNYIDYIDRKAAVTKIEFKYFGNLSSKSELLFGESPMIEYSGQFKCKYRPMRTVLSRHNGKPSTVTSFHLQIPIYKVQSSMLSKSSAIRYVYLPNRSAD